MSDAYRVWVEIMKYPRNHHPTSTIRLMVNIHPLNTEILHSSLHGPQLHFFFGKVGELYQSGQRCHSHLSVVLCWISTGRVRVILFFTRARLVSTICAHHLRPFPPDTSVMQFSIEYRHWRLVTRALFHELLVGDVCLIIENFVHNPFIFC